tara:strand:+ start:74887 stop:76059 length:1173 start_codon:yes stop_codon:yes gene_type:complete
MNKNIIALLFICMGINQVKSQDSESIVLGTKHLFQSKVFNEDREYWVSLPDSYNDDQSSHKRYPVLMVLDGNIHFKSIAGVVNYLSSDAYRSWKIPEMIVVGVKNVDRRRDYTPDKVITVRENNTGGGEKFLSFLEDELIPELDSHYRTEPYRILFGHSLSALLTTHAYMKEKSLFSAFIAVDPSFGTWDVETMDKKLEAVTDRSFKRFFYLATANWGKRNIRNRDRHVRFYEGLNSKCEGAFPAKMEYFENENHASVPPIAFYNGISTLFDGYGVSYRDVKSKKQLMQHFQSISHRLSWDFRPPEQLVNRIGYGLLGSRNKSERSKALAYFILNTENFPNSYNAFDSLGEAYEALGDKKKALDNYSKSLELNPKNEHIRMKLSELGKRE